jgi:hypothetical protein
MTFTKSGLAKMKGSDSVQSVCKESLCLHFGIQNIELSIRQLFIFSCFCSIINDQDSIQQSGFART